MSIKSSFFISSVIALIHLYQKFLSPLQGQVCRFVPSCSEYTLACIIHRGVIQGGVLALVRLCKCHPFHPGGDDPPPIQSGFRSLDREGYKEQPFTSLSNK
ncbi:membrane protein insertion efficiency factor YidD [Pajaroellobacter abortibovis]|uniref:Putative membrane protein insertion efficiency factor n=1 Tax=Pajaroellobacter abortibovis TaxID=1882918 RepID=A0A1L6MXY9_9BACT|nr:membrane protein insertion efficiency factor YidD [Pajaroellobacter abortibovis]APS00471.1 membrane protein insertion efficiency factor YidD [Pajaroellobacter abortibovis]